METANRIEMVELTEELFEELKQLSEEKDHDLFSPTHAFVKDGKVVGGCSVGAVCMTHCFWSNGMTGRDMFTAVDQMKFFGSSMGYEHFIIPVGDESPLNRHMHRFGANYVGCNHLFVGECK